MSGTARIKVTVLDDGDISHGGTNSFSQSFNVIVTPVNQPPTVSAVAPGAGAPTGTVTFSDGANAIGTGTLTTVAGQQQATFTTSALSVATPGVSESNARVLPRPGNVR